MFGLEWGLGYMSCFQRGGWYTAVCETTRVNIPEWKKPSS